MKNVKKSLSNLLCIILIAFYICSFNCIGNIDINAENNENLENPDVFESIESKILKEEEYYADGEEESNVYLDIDKMYFLPDEDILVSYLVTNEQEITNFDYTATGFEVVDIGIDEENNRINVELCCLPHEENYLLDLCITLGDKYMSVSLYAFNNEYGVFVSQFSKSNAFENML